MTSWELPLNTAPRVYNYRLLIEENENSKPDVLAGEMAQSVKYLLCKQETLNWAPWHTYKNGAWPRVSETMGKAVGEGRTERSRS